MTNEGDRLRIAVLFGGRSAEHEVSVLSATNVVGALDTSRYAPVPVYITREGRWLLSSFDSGRLAQPCAGVEWWPIPGGRGRTLVMSSEGVMDFGRVDALFPVLHGPNGEDGSVQGLASVAGIPLVGCGILGSATALDKSITKRLLTQAGVPVARSLVIRSGGSPTFSQLTDILGLPVFLKATRQGSSVGVRKVGVQSDYLDALAYCFKHGDVLLAEEFIDARELECSVIEGPDGECFVSRPGEIITADKHNFYTYEAKYLDPSGAVLSVPAALPAAVESQMRETAVKAFHALGCDSMARVDFFLTADMKVLVNEVNTIPGFTDVSMYPKALEASGISYSELLDRLIAHGLSRGVDI